MLEWSFHIDFNTYMLHKNNLNTHLETVEKVVKTPCNNHIVVQRHKERNQTGGDSDAPQPGVYGIPDPQGAQPHFLTDSQFD